MNSSAILLFAFLLGSTQAVTLIGTALSAFSPCRNGAMYMSHESGKPPSLDNYFDGSISLQLLNNTISEHVIRFVFVSPINGITIRDGTEGRVDQVDDTYLITFTPKEGAITLSFRVQGKKDELFPDLVSLHIDGVDSCPDPGQWRRKPMRAQAVAYSDDLNSEERAKDETDSVVA